jgi:TPR repeat protein
MRWVLVILGIMVASALQGCGVAFVGGAAVTVTGLEEAAAHVEPTDLKVVHEGTSQEDIEEAFGEPSEVKEVEESEIFIYPYNKGIDANIPSTDETCPMGACVFLFPIYLADLAERREKIVARQVGYLAVLYGDDDRVVAFSPIPNLGQANEVGQLMHLAVTEDAEAQYQLAELQGSFSAKWSWSCRAAHHAHPKAQYDLGNYSWFAHSEDHDGLVTAYVWYTLAGDIEYAEGFKEQIAREMTDAQISRADRRLKEWEPNTGACAARPRIDSFDAFDEWLANKRNEQIKRQALAGDADSMNEMGESALTIEDSVRWFCLAAHHGNAESQHKMGRIYAHGTEWINQDLVAAYVWYSLAKSNGYEESGPALNYRKTASGGWKCCFSDPPHQGILEKLTSTQIVKANRLLDEWEPNPSECAAISAPTEN